MSILLEDLETVQKARDDIKKALQDVGGGIVTDDITTYADIIRKIGNERNARAITSLKELPGAEEEYFNVNHDSVGLFTKAIYSPIDCDGVTISGDLFMDRWCNFDYICLKNLTIDNSSLFQIVSIRSLEFINLKLVDFITIINGSEMLESLSINGLDMTLFHNTNIGINAQNLKNFKITGEITPPSDTVSIDNFIQSPLLTDESLESVLDLFIAIGEMYRFDRGSQFSSASGLNTEQIVRVEELYPSKVSQLEGLGYTF